MLKVPEEIFLSIRSSSFYLQKYVVYRKRNLCRSKGFCRLVSFDKKNIKTKKILPASDQLNADATTTLNGLKVD
jgi:uroporphyrinogen-III synthase